MTPDQRFERIEQTLQAVAEGLLQNHSTLKTVTQTAEHAYATIGTLG